MNIKEVLKEVLKENGVGSTEELSKALTQGINAKLETMKVGDELSFGQGSIKIVASQQAARTARNPKTGEAIQVPAKVALKMKVGSKLKEVLNK